MKRRAITGMIMIAIILLTGILRTCAQVNYFRFNDDKGTIAISREWIFIRDKRDTTNNFDLYIIRQDTIQPIVYYAVISAQGTGFFWITRAEFATLDLNIEQLGRSRIRKFVFKK
jgi:hypothetical protein